MTLLGGILGPAMFFAGVDRLAAHHAAVLQHLEFGLTVLAGILEARWPEARLAYWHYRLGVLRNPSVTRPYSPGGSVRFSSASQSRTT